MNCVLRNSFSAEHFWWTVDEHFERDFVTGHLDPLELVKKAHISDFSEHKN